MSWMVKTDLPTATINGNTAYYFRPADLDKLLGQHGKWEGPVDANTQALSNLGAVTLGASGSFNANGRPVSGVVLAGDLDCGGNDILNAGGGTFAGQVLAPNQHRCHVYAVSPQAIPTGSTWTALQYDTEAVDVGNMFTLATSATKIVAPATGIYLVTAGCSFTGSTTGIRYIALTVNDVGRTVMQHSYPGPAGDDYMAASLLMSLSAGDWITVDVQQTSGGPLNTAIVFAIVQRLS